MAATREAIDARLEELEAKLPQLIRDYPDDHDFWCAFAGEADAIEDVAGEHCPHVRARLNCMLGSQGLVPSENEGESCADA